MGLRQLGCHEIAKGGILEVDRCRLAVVGAADPGHALGPGPPPNLQLLKFINRAVINLRVRQHIVSRQSHILL